MTRMTEFSYSDDPNNGITEYSVIRMTRITEFGDSDEFG
jgi:hypothetical protein